MPRLYTKYTKELLTPIVLSSTTYAECLRKLGLKDRGGNYITLLKWIDLLNIDTSHMTGQSHNAGKQIKPFDELTNKNSIRKRLLEENGNICSRCSLTEWLGQPITLELEHKDGDNRNHSRLNVCLLCPNCHSQTLTWKNRKRK